MILSCHNISKSYGTNIIIKDATFNIEDREKVAIVGINGAGKSTLLKIIMNEINEDSGLVVIAKDKKIGFLSQHQDFSTNNTIYDELLDTKKDLRELEDRIRIMEREMSSKEGEELEKIMNSYSRMCNEFEMNNGYAYKSEIIGVLKGLGFTEEEFNKKVRELSGGQKTRVALGKLLVSKPDIILLDEPTNHLDLSSIEWLENYLLNYNGAVVIVAHDRYFIDKICTKIIDIDNGDVRVYNGNYTEYAQKKKLIREAAIKEYLNQQKEIKHQEEVIEKLKSFNREKSIKRAESRMKMLDKMEVVDKPIDIETDMKLHLEPSIESGKDVLEVVSIAKSFDGKALFSNVSFSIKRGEKVALIGKNGTGKTTILKMINGLYEKDCGEIRLGAKVMIGYYDQEHSQLDLDKTPYEEISDAYPNMTHTMIRNTLAAFLFTGDDVFKRIQDLSGGERGRIALAKLMLSNANFLILDEPTNHLDINSKEILENVLKEYKGTVFFVSHDRYFINNTATRILDLENNRVTNYVGNYDYYISKKEELYNAKTVLNEIDDNKSANSALKDDWLAMKERKANERKIKSQISNTEEQISDIENRINEIDEKLSCVEIATDLAKVMKLHTEREELNNKLNDLYAKWEELVESSI